MSQANETTAANAWVESYLNALLTYGLSSEYVGPKDDKKAPNAESKVYSRYYVQSLLKLDEEALKNAYFKAVSATKHGGEKDARLEFLSWRIWYLKRKHATVERLRHIPETSLELLEDTEPPSREYSSDEDEASRSRSSPAPESAGSPKIPEVSQPPSNLRKISIKRDRNAIPTTTTTDADATRPSKATFSTLPADQSTFDAFLEDYMLSPHDITPLTAHVEPVRLNRLYIVMISLHGLVRGDRMELGKDSDTGGQVKYVVELARAMSLHPAVQRVDLLTRLIQDPSVDEDYGKEEECLAKGRGDLGGAYIVRLPCGPTNKYIPKESLWPHIREFSDRAIDHISTMLSNLAESGRRCDLYCVHGHYADAGEAAVLIANSLDAPVVMTGHSLGRNKLEHLLSSGTMTRSEIESTYKISRRIEAEERCLDVAAMVFTSTQQEVDEQWGLYDGYSPSLARVLRLRRTYGRHMPVMKVSPPGLDFSNLKVTMPDDPVLLEFEKERAALAEMDLVPLSPTTTTGDNTVGDTNSNDTVVVVEEQQQNDDHEVMSSSFAAPPPTPELSNNTINTSNNNNNNSMDVIHNKHDTTTTTSTIKATTPSSPPPPPPQSTTTATTPKTSSPSPRKPSSQPPSPEQQHQQHQHPLPPPPHRPGIIIPHGPPIWQDIARFLRNPLKPAILAMSRPDAKKNIATLVKAFGEHPLLRELANLVLIMGNRDAIDSMAGGTQRVLMQVLKLIDAHDLYGSVAYPKHHTQADISDIYLFARETRGVFVNIALQEPFGLTVIEAAAHGVPTVATCNGGPVDIMATLHHGVVVDPTDANAVAAALLSILTAPETWDKMADSGVDNIMAYSWPAHCKRYMETMDMERKLTRRHHRKDRTLSGLLQKSLSRLDLLGYADAVDGTAVGPVSPSLDQSTTATTSTAVAAMEMQRYFSTPGELTLEQPPSTSAPGTPGLSRVTSGLTTDDLDIIHSVQNEAAARRSAAVLEVAASKQRFVVVPLDSDKFLGQVGQAITKLQRMLTDADLLDVVGIGVLSMLGFDSTYDHMNSQGVDMTQVDFIVCNSGADVWLRYEDGRWDSDEAYESLIEFNWDRVSLHRMLKKIISTPAENSRRLPRLKELLYNVAEAPEAGIHPRHICLELDPETQAILASGMGPKARTASTVRLATLVTDRLKRKLRSKGFRANYTVQLVPKGRADEDLIVLHITPVRASRPLALRTVLHRLGLSMESVVVMMFPPEVKGSHGGSGGGGMHGGGGGSSASTGDVITTADSSTHSGSMYSGVGATTTTTTTTTGSSSEHGNVVVGSWTSDACDIIGGMHQVFIAIDDSMDDSVVIPRLKLADDLGVSLQPYSETERVKVVEGGEHALHRVVEVLLEEIDGKKGEGVVAVE